LQWRIKIRTSCRSEGLADLREPWTIKIVLDYVIGSKQPPQWLSHFIASSFRADKFAMRRLKNWSSRRWAD
jgi:hypothetical protein